MMEFIKIVVGTFAGFLLVCCAMLGLAANKKFLKWYCGKYMDTVNEVTEDLVNKF